MKKAMIVLTLLMTLVIAPQKAQSAVVLTLACATGGCSVSDEVVIGVVAAGVISGAVLIGAVGGTPGYAMGALLIALDRHTPTTVQLTRELGKKYPQIENPATLDALAANLLSAAKATPPKVGILQTAANREPQKVLVRQLSLTREVVMSALAHENLSDDEKAKIVEDLK